MNNPSNTPKTPRWLIGFVAFSVFILPHSVFGFVIENIGSSGAPYKDFVVGPGKIELEIEPGRTKTAEIKVTNRMGDTRLFKLEIEDFTGSRDPRQTVVLLGGERGPYSLKDFISFSEETFELKDGERATIPVTVSLPTDVEPGGLFGSVLVSTISKRADGSVGNSASPIVSRIGALFFVKVPGDVNEDGRLVSLEIAKRNFLTDSDAESVTFRLLFENNGSTYLNPYGEINVNNMLGETVGTVIIDPWFAMPDSLRLREVSWDKPFLFGRYTATAQINRGYDDIIDTTSVSFWVIPWRLALGVVLGAAIVIFGLRFILTRFEFRRKR